MTSPAESSAPRLWSFGVSVGRSPILLWVVFVLVHLWLGLVNLIGPGLPLGDVTYVYRFWTDQAVVSHYVVGIDGPWVYPIVAFVPMMLARVFGVGLYSSTWLSLVMILDVIAFGVMTGWGRYRQHFALAWWWIVFLLLLGPIALGRIDSISVPLAIVGVLLVATRPRAAAVILTIATWIKVWPAALIAAILISVRARGRVILAAFVTSLFIVAATLALGSRLNVFSFVSQQATRGLQIEAPVSTIWLWMAFAHVPNTLPYYDDALLTWQIRGPGVDQASALMTPLLALVMLAVAALGVLAVRNRVAAHDLLPPLTIAFVVAFIAVNKVGSPQYLTWLAAPIILGLATNAAGRGRSFRTPAIIVLVLAALTQLIYPYLYGYLISLNVLMLTVISVRNLLFFVLLGWAVASIWRMCRSRDVDSLGEVDEAWLPVIWPFGIDTEPRPDDDDDGADRLDELVR